MADVDTEAVIKLLGRLEQEGKRRSGVTGEMKSFTPTMGQRISSAFGHYYGPRLAQAADILGLTMPYDGGRAAAEGVASGDTGQTIKGAALLALSPVPGLAMGAIRSKALPYFAEPALDKADSLVRLFQSGRADFADRSALQAIKPQIDAMPRGTMRAPASFAATGSSAVAGGLLAGASAPFDPSSYEDWIKVGLGAMGGAAAERFGAAAASAPAVSRQFVGAVDVPRVETTRAMIDAALATKQGKKLVTQLPPAPSGPVGNPANMPALPAGAGPAVAPALPPVLPPAPKPGRAVQPTGSYTAADQSVLRPFVSSEVAAGRNVPSLDDVISMLSQGNVNKTLPKSFGDRLDNAQGIVSAMRASGVDDATISSTLVQLMNKGVPRGLPALAGGLPLMSVYDFED